jgi:signal transduction histidine kinase
MPPASEPDPIPASPALLDRAHHTLLETARQLGSSLEPEAIFKRLTDSVRGAMRCDGLIVSSYDRAENLIRCSYAWVGGNVLDATTLPPLELRPDGGGMQSQVIRSGRPMLFSDVADRVADPKGTYYEVDPHGGVRNLRGADPPASRSAIMVPLRLEGEVVGVVQAMADADQVYTSADLELLEGISLLLAVALENARLYRRAQDEIEERRRAESDLRRTEEALREVDRRKDEFLATLGHELRNPLSPIRNAVELLQRPATSDVDARWSHQVIERQVVHLTRLIDDLLDVGRITQGKLELRRETVEVHDLLAGVVEPIHHGLEAAGQHLTVRRAAGPVLVHADPIRLAQVFSNLIDNAIKYSAPGGRIDLLVERGADQVEISVEDDGAGITAEHLPNVFGLFYQADRSSQRTQAGLGIGLTLARRLVEMHDGTIEAFSDGPGRGSRFVVRLPAVAGAEAPAARARVRSTEPMGSLRVLVADDNRDSADSLAMLLEVSGHEVHVSYDGEEAVRLAAEVRPEVLLLDIGMPRLDGYQVATRLRGEPWGAELVIIATTGWGQEQDRTRSRETGFDAHLVKPVDLEALMQLISELATR